MNNADYDQTRPLAEQVAERLKEYILKGKLKSSDKLPTEAKLSVEMNVARSTVREAIKRLESQNILTVRHGAGSFVADNTGLTEDPLGLAFFEDKWKLTEDLLEIRTIIEPAIAELAAGIMAYNILFFTYVVRLFQPEQKVSIKSFLTPTNITTLIMVVMPLDRTLCMGISILAACPASSLTAVLARQHDLKDVLASQAVAQSTLFIVISIPLLLSLAGVLFR